MSYGLSQPAARHSACASLADARSLSSSASVISDPSRSQSDSPPICDGSQNNRPHRRKADRTHQNAFDAADSATAPTVDPPHFRLLGRASSSFVAVEVMHRYPAQLYRLVPRKRGGWMVFGTKP